MPIRVISVTQHQQIIETLKAQLEEQTRLWLAMAMLLVRAAGGKITVPETMIISLDNTSWLQEDRDPNTGDRVFYLLGSSH